MSDELKTGPEIVDEMQKDPTLDKFLDFLDRNPHSKPYTDEELREWVEVQRQKRALYIQKEMDK